MLFVVAYVKIVKHDLRSDSDTCRVCGVSCAVADFLSLWVMAVTRITPPSDPSLFSLAAVVEANELNNFTLLAVEGRVALAA